MAWPLLNKNMVKQPLKKRVFLTVNTAKLGVVFDGTKRPYQLKIQTFYPCAGYATELF